MATEKDTFDSTFGSTPFNPFTSGGGSGGSGLASNNPFGQSQTEYRERTAGDNWKQFFGFDIGATNQEGIDKGRSNQLGNILDIQTQILGDARTFKNTEWEDLPDQSAFRDEEAFNKFKNELEVDDTDLFKLTPSTAVTLGKALGDESNGRYNASLLQNSLGYDYKLFGGGKKIDWLGSQYGINQNGRYAIINPLVRSVGRNKDGGQFFYSADLTSDGTNLADMTDSEIASDQAFLGGVTKDFAGQDIPINKYLDTAYKALYTDLINKMPNGGQIGAMVGLTEQAFNQYKGEFDKVSSETTDRRTKLEALTKIINATEQEEAGFAEDGDGLTYTTPGDMVKGPEIRQANTKEEILSSIESLKDNQKQAAGFVEPVVTSGVSPTGGFYVEGTTTGKREGMDRSELVVYPKGSVYDLSKDQLSRFSIREQEKLARESNELSNKNANIIAEYTAPLINQRIAQERRADPTGDISTQDRKDNIKTVQEFYKEVKGTKEHKELVDKLSANPEKLQEYLNDPYEFALNNTKDDIFGVAVSPTDDSAIRDSLSKESLTYFPKIKKAIEGGESIDKIRTLINQAIEVNDNDQANLEKLSNIPAMANGNLGQASPVAKYGAMLRIYGTMEPNSKMYNTFMSSDNVTNFLTYGTFIAPKEVEAPEMDRGFIESFDSTVDNLLNIIDETKLAAATGKERKAILTEGNNQLALANSQFMNYLRTNEGRNQYLSDGQFRSTVLKYQNANARLIQQKIKDLASTNMVRRIIEKIPFVSNYNRDPVAFGQVASRLRYDPDAKRFRIMNPAGGSNISFIEEEDILNADEGGKPLLEAMKRMAEVNQFIETTGQRGK